MIILLNICSIYLDYISNAIGFTISINSILFIRYKGYSLYKEYFLEVYRCFLDGLTTIYKDNYL